MSTERLYGSRNEPLPDLRGHFQFIDNLWHVLAAQNEGTADYMPNNMLCQRKNEFLELAQLVARQRPRVVAEIGVAQAATLAAWMRLSHPNAKFICIDRDVNDALPRPGEPVHPSIYNGPIRGMTEQGGGVYHLVLPGQTLHVINGWTYEPGAKEKFLNALGDDKIDLLFHDASHQAEMFAEDFKWMWPLVAEGGMLCSHDIQPSSVPNITKSIEWERIKREETYSAVYEWRGGTGSDSFGLGCLIK